MSEVRSGGNGNAMDIKDITVIESTKWSKYLEWRKIMRELGEKLDSTYSCSEK